MINITLKCQKKITIIWKIIKILNTFFGYYECVLTHLFHSDLIINFAKCNNTLSSLVLQWYGYQFFNNFFKIFFSNSQKLFSTIWTFLFCASYNTIILELFEHIPPYGQSSIRRREGSLCLQENKVQYHHDNLLLDQKVHHIRL